MKPPLLYLCHRIPYPPNKGDKIRSFHLLKDLNEHYEVYLGAFIDDPKDWEYVPKVDDLCTASCFLPLDATRSKLKSLIALPMGDPLTLPYYQNRKMSQWVDQVVTQHKIERAIVYSSAMAQYITDKHPALNRKVIDFVDIDSDKWRQYSQKKSWPLSWVYQREADKLFAYEKKVVSEFDASLFVSSAEAALFCTMTSSHHERIAYYNNGVDTEYFLPSAEFTNPYPDDRDVLVFTGAMDYWPNIDAVNWFVDDVLPSLLRRSPNIYLYIVGSNPSDRVRRLGNQPHVEVTGRVEDIRPYIQYARMSVAPMRVARGIQNKVLEAMAMEKVVIVTPQGFEGIHAIPGTEMLLVESAQEMINTIPEVLEGDYKEMGKAARSRVQSDFSWEENLPIVRECLETGKGNYDR